MKILMLGPYRKHIIEFLESLGDEVVHYEKKLKAESPILEGVDFIVSYGFQFIIKDDVLVRFSRRIINLHISLLPYNKGADPNLWSFLEDTPKGVSIHFIDKGVDTGDILAQREIIVPANATLRTSYDALSKTIEHLFMETWPRIREGKQKWHSQSENGSKHRLKEKAAYEHLLTEGWDTPVKNLIGKALLEVS